MFETRNPYGLAQQAIALTEQEIFNEVMGVDDELMNDDDFGEASQIDGWDGQAVSDAEGLATASGDGDGLEDELGNAYLGDRPLQFMAEKELRRELAQVRALNAKQSQDIGQWIMEPQQQAEREQRKQQFEDQYGVVVVDDDAWNRLDADLHGIGSQMQQQTEARLNASFQAAHGHFGDDFAEQYEALTAMDPNSAAARGLVNDISNAADPGQALMEIPVEYLRGLGTGRRGQIIPSLNSATPGSGYRSGRGRARGGGWGDSDGADGGWGNPGVEQSVFDSAWLE